MLDFSKGPIIGLSPMDGVSDAPFRYITHKYGSPDATFTEFVHVIGICRGGERLWQDFIFADRERPISAQLFGTETEYFYHAAKIAAEMGFDGVDINMGCPARSVAEHGAGAALIRTPELAKEIVKAVQKGVKDWYETGELTGITNKFKQRVERMVDERKRFSEKDGVEFKRYANGADRSVLPVSVKTRIGYSEVTVRDWIKTLTEVEPAWLTIHGRTLKQLYTGQADWDAIAAGVESTHLPVLANGDIKSVADIKRVLELTKAKGVLLGRASYGNPWLFKNLNKFKQDFNSDTTYIPSLEERFAVVKEHVKLHLELKGPGSFVQLRKHLGWYMSGFPEAAELRKQLVVSNNEEEVEQILDKALSRYSK
jgi:tRNA-dihydrouridine synthase B